MQSDVHRDCGSQIAKVVLYEEGFTQDEMVPVNAVRSKDLM